jgi:hypothetical protein
VGQRRQQPYKCLGNILALQERIAAAWREWATGEPAQDNSGSALSDQTKTSM